ncbi:MAG TPA: GNAT family N-acetyltransferase [Selenomonadales bacterium]|nr:GNAT family N-acetyltransferase [Selenomonadales bacterium]
MVSYQCCADVEANLIFEAFNRGFSDYSIRFELAEQAFMERFFGPEGNSREYSFLALAGGSAVGVILGGLKNYEGIRTMRCGTLAVDPEYRGTGVARKLFELHKQEAVSQGCRQLFLEVLTGNDRAIQFYRKLGYEKIYDLAYFSLPASLEAVPQETTGYRISPIGLPELRQSVRKASNVHINWQNDMDYMEKSSSLSCFGAYRDGELVAGLCVNPQGKIHFLWVDADCRARGIARRLLGTAQAQLQPQQFSTGFPNNHLLEGFLKRLGFARNAVAQYEMYLTL